MTSNIGTADQVIRIVAGLLLIGLAAAGTIGVWGYIGIVPLATALVRWCPIYSALGIATRPKQR